MNLSPRSLGDINTSCYNITKGLKQLSVKDEDSQTVYVWPWLWTPVSYKRLAHFSIRSLDDFLWVSSPLFFARKIFPSKPENIKFWSAITKLLICKKKKMYVMWCTHASKTKSSFPGQVHCSICPFQAPLKSYIMIIITGSIWIRWGWVMVLLCIRN